MTIMRNKYYYAYLLQFENIYIYISNRPVVICILYVRVYTYVSHVFYLVQENLTCPRLVGFLLIPPNFITIKKNYF